MDFDKLKQWMEVAQKYQQGDFWDVVFEQSAKDQLMDEFPLNNSNSEQNQRTLKNFPKTDIYMTDTAVIILLELPGVMKEDIFLSVSGNKLLVKGIVKIPIMNAVSAKTERMYGEFQRTIQLPESTDSKDIQARFENGLIILSYIRKYSQEERIFIR